MHLYVDHYLRSSIPDNIEITNSADLRTYLINKFRHLATEEFHALFFDKGYRLIASQLLWRGTTDRVAVYPTEIVKRALQLSASNIVLAHNHPSRRINPSRDDYVTTRKIIDACRPIDIEVLDHVIIAGEQYLSMRALDTWGGAPFGNVS